MGYLDEIIAKFESNNNLLEAMEDFNELTNTKLISEEAYTKTIEHLRVGILDVNRFVQVNDCKQITNPVFYDKASVPTSDGLLSNEIFGITKEDRAGTFAYIDLGQYYLDPSCYKCWYRIDPKIKRIVHKDGTFIINSKGEIEEAPDGKNGIKWLKDNINKIDFKRNSSLKRDLRINYLEMNRGRMFINKYLVIPPYYRDTNTGKRSVGVGGVNKLYSQLIIAVNALKSTQEFGFDLSGPQEGRVQEIIQNLYDWFIGNSNSTIQTDEGAGISGKRGIFKNANMGKTINYTARLVLSAPELKVNRPEDMKTDYYKSCIPLAACIACFRPFIAYNVRAFFEKEFIGTELYPVVDRSGKVVYKKLKDPLIEFSDERIHKEMEHFIHAYNNRFVTIPLPVENTKDTYYMYFNGRFRSDNPKSESIVNRKLTWCDLFFMAAVDAVKNRYVAITRYPIDSRTNQTFTAVEVSSTTKTEPMIVDGEFYPYYPVIRTEDLGKSTGNKFVDTCNICNLYLASMGADYDGDTVSVKGIFTDEANEEIRKFINEKQNYLSLDGGLVRGNGDDVKQSLYMFTKILDDDKNKLTQPTF